MLHCHRLNRQSPCPRRRLLPHPRRRPRRRRPPPPLPRPRRRPRRHRHRRTSDGIETTVFGSERSLML